MDISRTSGATKDSMASLLSKTIKNSSGVNLGIDVVKDTVSKDFSIKTLLDSLFNDLAANTKSKDTVLQILKDKNIPSNIKETAVDIKSIAKNLEKSDISAITKGSLEKLLLDIDKLDAKTLQTQIKNSGVFLESKLADVGTNKSMLPSDFEQTLQSLKSLSLDKDLRINSSLIDKILNSKVADGAFIDNVKSLLNSLKTLTDEPLVQVSAKLETFLQKSRFLESKFANSIPISTDEIQSMTKNIEQVLGSIKLDVPEIELALSSLKSAIRVPQNLKVDISSISEKLQQVVNLLKNELALTQPKAELHIELAKLTQKATNELSSAVKNGEISSNQILQTTVDAKEQITKDIKANLLQIKEEIIKSNDSALKDMLPRVDRVLTNISYYQLSSFSMGVNVLYLPLLWDGLDEGQVSIKKLKQKRFFCEINLKLRDFGKIELLVMLFEDINISISIFTQSDEFLKRIRENLYILKQGINSVGLISSNIYLYNSLRDEKINKKTKLYAKSQQVGSGISLHV